MWRREINMAGVYGIISMIGFILAIVFFVAAVILFFIFRIDRVIGNLTGMNARKAMKERQKKALENDNHNSNSFSYADFDVTTDELATDELTTDKLATDKLSTDKLTTDKLATGKLSMDKLATGKLSTDELSSETSILSSDAIISNDNVTEILQENNRNVTRIFDIVDEITLISTDERI